jgi:hypothetical protein
MTTTAAPRIDRTPTHNDLEVTRLVHRALADVRDAGRYGDRKVFIASLWTKMLDIEAQTGGTLTDGATTDHFKAWLVRSRLFTCDGTENGARLIVLCRADLVAAMNPALVTASETVTDGAVFHFVTDPAIAREDYAPRTRSPMPGVPSATTGRVGKVGASRRAA